MLMSGTPWIVSAQIASVSGVKFFRGPLMLPIPRRHLVARLLPVLPSFGRILRVKTGFVDKLGDDFIFSESLLFKGFFEVGPVGLEPTTKGL